MVLIHAEIFTFFPKVETGAFGVRPGVGGELGLDEVSVLKYAANILFPIKAAVELSFFFLSPNLEFDFVRL